MNKVFKLIILLVLFHSINSLAQDEGSFKQLIIPESGTWWNPDQPGTGISMQFSKNDSWFVIFYLYDENGEPTFYTMQGDSLEYSLDRTEFPDSAYARATGTLYRSIGGRCLGCEYQSPETSSIQATADIFFFQKGSARIVYSSVLGYLTEDLTAKLLPNDVISDDDYNNNTQTIHFLGNGYNSSYLVETISGITTIGISPRKYQCFHCDIELNSEQYNYTSLIVGEVSYPTGPVGPLGPVQFILESNQLINYNTVVGKSGIYGIIDEETAVTHGIPTQILIYPAYH